MERAKLGTGLEPNLRTLSLFRLAFGVYLLLDFEFNLAPHLTDFFSDHGLLPLAALASDAGWVGLPWMQKPLIWIELLHIRSLMPLLFPLCALGFACGYYARTCTAFLLVLNGYMYWRNPMTRSGAETLAHLLLIWSFFLPLNRHYSVDSALATGPSRQDWPSIPFVAMRVQIASLYVFSGLFKCLGEPWRQGIALSQIMRDNMFAAPMADYWIRLEPSWLSPVACYFVIAFQLSFPLLVYSPWRNDWTRGAAVAGAAMLHLAFLALLNVGNFPYLCLVMLILLVPDKWLDRAFQSRRERLAGMKLFYDDGCEFCRKLSLLIRELILSRIVVVAPASTNSTAHELLHQHRSWVVRTPAGSNLLKSQAAAYIASQSALTAPIALLMRSRVGARLSDSMCDLVGRSRRKLWRLSHILLRNRTERGCGQVASAICCGLSIIALAGNVLSVFRGEAQPSALTHILGALQIRQHWSLFAPVPTRSTWSFSATPGSDSSRDLLGGPTAWLVQPLPDGRIEFSNHRWLKYFSRFETLTADEWAAFGRFLCRRADGDMPPVHGRGDAAVVFEARRVELGAIAAEVRHNFPCQRG